MTSVSRIWTFPNVLTTLRILLIPFFFWACFQRFEHFADQSGGAYAALTWVLFAFIVISDWLDGYLARRLGQQTSLGAFLDPLADKALVATSFVLLAALGRFPVWLSIVVVSRDVILFLGWCLLYVMQYDTSIRPWKVGKLTAVLHFACIGVALVQTPPMVERGLWSLTGLFTLASALCYIYEGLRRATPRRRGMPTAGEKDAPRVRPARSPDEAIVIPESDSEKSP